MPVLVTVSLLVAGYDLVIASLGLEVSGFFTFVSGIVFISLLALWVQEDSRRFPLIYRPYEFGFLISVYWVFYVPYYLWRTRGAKGLAIFLGLILLSTLGSIAKSFVYGTS